MTTRAWFPTLIYEAPLLARGGPAFARELLAECRRIRAHDAEGRAWCRKHYPGGYTSYASMNRLQKNFSTFAALERNVDRHVASFARRLELELGHGRLRMTTCWVNVMSRRAAHGLHLHPLSVVSGTCYVKTPPGASRIRFEDPRLERFMAAPPRAPAGRPENRTHVVYPVKAGNVLLFESWLRHEVPPQEAAGERVSVSFNYEWA
jgi:uncharacterized protein (TIGR02466 family)